MIYTNSFFATSCNKKYTLFTKQWENRNQPIKGILQIVHGMVEHVQRYEEFATYMATQGFLVIGHDHIAHGHSVQKNDQLGIMDKNDWFTMVQDVHQISQLMQKKYPQTPYFLLGHSMGSFVVRTYIMIYDTQYLHGILLSGTAWHSRLECELGKKITHFLSLLQGKNHRNRLLFYLTLGQFNKPFKPNTTPVDWLSRDNRYNESYMKDEKCRFTFSLGAYRELFRGLKYISEKKHLKKMRTSLPVYFFSGSKDPVGNFGKGITHVVQDFKQVGMSNITLKIYPEGRHEMLHEINKQEVFSDLYKWIEMQL